MNEELLEHPAQGSKFTQFKRYRFGSDEFRAYFRSGFVPGDAGWEYLRMHNGYAYAVLCLLETQAAQRGCHRFVLETGPKQPEALAFYARNGYVTRGRFGDYRDDPLSVFMEKRLAA